jgi:hypothetical protein
MWSQATFDELFLFADVRRDEPILHMLLLHETLFYDAVLIISKFGVRVEFLVLE